MRIFLPMLFFALGIHTLCQAQLSDNYDISVSPNGVIAMPSGLPSAYNSFVKYTKIQAPNGKAIHFIAQNAITEAQIVRARNILQFYLTNIPGSQYGADKSAITNQIADNDAILMLLNGSDGDTNPPNVNGQPLYQNEIAVEGHTWYINNDYENHRDASFEEILHLMHDTGIGVDGPNTYPGALPAYQTEIRAAQDNADNGFQIWPLGGGNNPDIQGWYNELSQENSLSQEYLAAVIDSYYGLWGAWEEPYGMWDIYIAKTRADIQSLDPMGWALMPKYFSPFININMDIDPTFNGIFTMAFDAAQLYTHKSQYLQHCTLTGTNAAGLKGNDEYNRLNGNNANNTLEGGKSHDKLNGNGGTDTAIFTGSSSEYTITSSNGNYLVSDNVSNRDGVDTLMQMEFAQFTDQNIELSTITASPEILLEDTSITIYPNPTENDLHIVLSSGNFDVKILDASGTAYQTISMSNHHTIDISQLPAGLFFLELTNTDNNQMYVRKMLKQ